MKIPAPDPPRRRSAVSRLGAERGFTLIEVVVALAILGSGLFVLLESHYSSLTLLSDAQQEAEIRIFLEGAMGKAENEILAGESNGSGDFGRKYPDFSYAFTSTETGGEEMPGLVEVSVSVTGPSETRTMVFYTYDGNQVERKPRT